MNRGKEGISSEMMSRGEFIRYTSIGMIGLASWAVPELNRPLVSAEKLLFADKLYDKRFRNSPYVTRSAIYPLQEDPYKEDHRPPVDDVFWLTLGDSIAAGYYSVSDKPHPAISEVVRMVNTSRPGTRWEERNLAQAWSTIADVTKNQLPQAQEIIKSHKQVNANLGIVGNTLIQGIFQEAQAIKDIEIATKSNLNPAWVRLADIAMKQIDELPLKIMGLLKNIRDIDKENHIGKIFIETLPNMSQTDTLTYTGPQAKFSVPVEGKVMETVTANIPLLVNMAIDKAVRQVGSDMGSIYILDNYHLDLKGEMVGIHPNQAGQDKMARNHVTRLFGQRPGRRAEQLYIPQAV